MYQLILFNLIQNSVKYNQYNGNILVILRIRPVIDQIECFQSLNEPKNKFENLQKVKKNERW